MHEDFPPHGLAGEGRDLAGQPPDLAEPRVVAGKQQGRPYAPKIGGQDPFPGLLKRRAEMSGDTRGKNLSLSVPTGEVRPPHTQTRTVHELARSMVEFPCALSDQRLTSVLCARAVLSERWTIYG